MNDICKPSEKSSGTPFDMLQKLKRNQVRRDSGRYAIIASQYNAKYVDSMLAAALKELHSACVKSVKVIRVPGAFEIPVVAARLTLERSDYSAIICLGVIIRGETTHAAHIATSITDRLGEIAVNTGIPVIHEVLLLESAIQARKRCLSKHFNRGTEAAMTAIKMHQVLSDLDSDK